jgi:hypothetical protein
MVQLPIELFARQDREPTSERPPSVALLLRKRTDNGGSIEQLFDDLFSDPAFAPVNLTRYEVPCYSRGPLSILRNI